ncbi:MAG: M23 family metallopeptidase [Bacteroidales bacterium]|nr:M23 family metallopeptidase [Bacteroidales bacterium]
MKKFLNIFLCSLVASAVLYLVFALCFDTATERRLKGEIAEYESEIPALSSRTAILEGAITALQMKDDSLFMSVFKTGAPVRDPVSSLDFLFGNDTIPNHRLVSYTGAKADNLLERGARVDSTLKDILWRVAFNRCEIPPLSLPLKGISYSQVGASTGRRISPVFAKESVHNGLDLIAFRGEPVYASADGVVKAVVKLRTGYGNYIDIEHAGGYVTRYAHLDEVFVQRGQRVKRSQKIGSLGMSGAAFAPHLHYEVMKDGEVLDPVHFFFLDVSPWEYANMLFMTTNTNQSLD